MLNIKQLFLGRKVFYLKTKYSYVYKVTFNAAAVTVLSSFGGDFLRLEDLRLEDVDSLSYFF